MNIGKFLNNHEEIINYDKWINSRYDKGYRINHFHFIGKCFKVEIVMISVILFFI